MFWTIETQNTLIMQAEILKSTNIIKFTNENLKLFQNLLRKQEADNNYIFVKMFLIVLFPAVYETCQGILKFVFTNQSPYVLYIFGIIFLIQISTIIYFYIYLSFTIQFMDRIFRYSQFWIILTSSLTNEIQVKKLELTDAT